MFKHYIVYQKKIRKYIRNKLRSGVGHGEFATRIRNRHKLFRITEDTVVITNTKLCKTDPIEKWHDGELWQRKLDNKYNSREFAKMHNCTVPELYWKGNDVSTIDFTRLPEQFVIRPITGHSSRGVFLMNKGINLLENRAYSNYELKEALTCQLNDSAGLEFLIEEFLKSEDGTYQIPKDYKFYTFNGEIACIQIISRVAKLAKRFTSYDIYWNRMPNTYKNERDEKGHERPKYLKEMIAQAKQLSKAYELFVRIDFYSTDTGPVFGEFTPTPSKGDFFSSSADRRFTRYWDKFCEGKI